MRRKVSHREPCEVCRVTRAAHDPTWSGIDHAWVPSWTASAEIDLAYDGSLRASTYALEVVYNVAVEIVNEAGPGGGWPVVRVWGREEPVRRALRETWGWSDEEIAEMKLLPGRPGSDDEEGTER